MRNLTGQMGKWVGALALAGFAAWAVGCAGTQQNGKFAPLEDAAAAVPEPLVDVIQVGEAITITFADLPMPVVPIEERVKEDGTITLLQNQTFVAAGKTRRQLEEEIRAAYVPKYYVNMSVSVKQQENTRFYFVGGEVKAPGRQVYLGSMSVLKAIQSCGDFTDFANKRKVQVIRANGRIAEVNANKALKDPSLDLPIYPGDRVHVPRSMW